MFIPIRQKLSTFGVFNHVYVFYFKMVDYSISFLFLEKDSTSEPKKPFEKTITSNTHDK